MERDVCREQAIIIEARIRARSWAGSQLRRGRRVVLQTPHSARVGNLLYFWLHAFVADASGRRVRVLDNDDVRVWERVWPSMVESFGTSTTRRTDRLLDVEVKHFQEFGVDFTREQLDEFISSYVMTPELASWLPPRDPHLLVVNVRRGDYYSNAEYRARYAMDVVGYVEQAVDRISSSTRIDRVALVSDDPKWCAQHLGWLRRLGTIDHVPGPPVAHLACLASAANLVLANSTFSYWGAYLAGAQGREIAVVAPRFHAAHVNEGNAWQLDPDWSVVERP